MKSPEVHRVSRHRTGREKFESDPDMQYLTPGAFTVLPTNDERKSTARPAATPTPSAPTSYKVSTNPSRRPRKHQSFAIIGEVNPSNSNSRSSSPTGRVSPFKGHGFNPLGSRHASPIGSPVPPSGRRSTSPTKDHSRIPRPTRKNSSGDIFGEKISHSRSKGAGGREVDRGGGGPTNRGLSRQFSQSLTNLDHPKKNINTRHKPPPSSSSAVPSLRTKSPKRQRRHRGAAFKQLSPILGSSPEPSQQSLSSPSRIPVKSKSTPPSRITSPTRYGGSKWGQQPPPAAPPLRQTQSNSNLLKGSHTSRKYQHVQPKIDSFHKPKVPPKPLQGNNHRQKNSVGRSSSKPNLLPKTFMGGNNNYTSDSSFDNDNKNESTDVGSRSKLPPTKPAVGSKVNTKFVANSSSTGNSSSKGDKESGSSNALKRAESRSKIMESKNHRPENHSPEKKGTADSIATGVPALLKKNSSNKLPVNKEEKEAALPPATAAGAPANKLPSATTVVSSTTNTVTKPLKIQTPTLDRSKVVSPIIDGRTLSSTSVSNAINRMNDTVLNTKTLIKDSVLHNRYNPAGTVTSDRVINERNEDESEPVKRNNNNHKKEEDNKTVDKKEDKEKIVEQDGQTKSISPPKTTAHQNHHHLPNHMSSTIGLGNAKALEMEVQKNMHKIIGVDDSTEPNLSDTMLMQNNNVNKMSANDRIREARTVVASDVKPIKITVREKPSDVDVQSGNLNAASHFVIPNGINDQRPGLPPPSAAPHQQPPPQNDSSTIKADESTPPANGCRRFWNSCRQMFICSPPCQCCRKQQEEIEEIIEEETNGCCPCLKRNHSNKDQVKINIEKDAEDNEEPKTCWQKLKCCRTNKVGDTPQTCFPFSGKRKETEDWIAQQSENVLRSVTEEDPTKYCSKQGCLDFLKKLFCCIGCGSCCYACTHCCKRKETEVIPPRKESIISGKKKSLTPTTLSPPEETRPKIDASLVEHNSHMKGAIPVLPVWLAWFCCIMNCIAPGIGTFLSGLFCLCIGKPRFSQNDGPKPRLGSFIINTIIGFSQLFTVLFCLVGWGWSIWWGVIMVKVAKKHRKLKQLEILEDPSSVTTRSSPNLLTGAAGGGGGGGRGVGASRSRRDIERGRT